MNFKFLKDKYIYILALLPLLSLFMVSFVIIVFLLGSFLSSIYHKDKNNRITHIGVILLFLLPFLMYLISLSWTDNLQVGLKYVEKTLSFCVLPIAIFILKPFKTTLQIRNFNKIFVIASAFSVVITMIYLLFNTDNIFNQQNTYFANIKLREAIELTPVIGEHAIYFSLIMAVALLLLFYNRFQNRWLNVFLSLLFITGIIIASSKGVILSILLVGILLAFQEIKNKRKVVVVVLLSFFGLGVITYLSPIKERVNEIVSTKHIYPKGDYYNSFNLRMAIYNCSFSLIKGTPIMGYSPGDIQQELNECYKKFNTNAFHKTNYNTHNQYLDYILSFGVIGLVIILFSFAYFLRIAIINKNKEYLNFLILFYLVFLTENILVRNTGIVLFTTFNCLFAYSILFNKKLKHNLNSKQ
ncbi:O-antigen ligase family protein [Sabulilitoribacter arenilitoris]|uniref:O-antigen ligase family protein n=1 Tax=Wocania arenilitoris TaxID=2044858 RepID=A0AAE3EJN4_9FLAO|nr:O-antigen ligase family protein [Wocania arenilitoris]MCF7566776.1 O-antigen ligase family protein [Wocania arenilitoris]